MLNLLNRTTSGGTEPAPPKSWKMIIVDALIVAAIAAFAVMGNEPPGVAELWVIVKAFGAAFFWQLALERGLKRPPPEEDAE